MQEKNKPDLDPPFSEAAILLRVSRAVSRAEKFSAGAERVAALLEQYVGATVLGTEVFSKKRVSHEPQMFEGNGQFPHAYSVGLREAGRDIGRVTIGFAVAPGEADERLARFVGEQLGTLFVTARLAEKNATARRQMQSMSEEMAQRKLVPRVIALLASRYRMRRHEAEAWLAAQSRSTGLTESEVAERLIAGHGDAARLVVTGHRQIVRLTA